ncbi:MAG: Spy/CpxP family protein refolding chaperone [Syntrophales bacterium]
MKAVNAILIAVLLIAVAGTAAADVLHSAIAKEQSGKISSLNLTAEQINKIQILREARWKEIMPLRHELFNKLAELNTLWNYSKPDEAKIRAKQQEIRNMQSQLQDKLTSHRLEVRKILTREQQAHIEAYGLERGYYRAGYCKAAYSGKTMGDMNRPQQD